MVFVEILFSPQLTPKINCFVATNFAKSTVKIQIVKSKPLKEGKATNVTVKVFQIFLTNLTRNARYVRVTGPERSDSSEKGVVSKTLNFCGLELFRFEVIMLAERVLT